MSLIKTQCKHKCNANSNTRPSARRCTQDYTLQKYEQNIDRLRDQMCNVKEFDRKKTNNKRTKGMKNHFIQG